MKVVLRAIGISRCQVEARLPAGYQRHKSGGQRGDFEGDLRIATPVKQRSRLVGWSTKNASVDNHRCGAAYRVAHAFSQNELPGIEHLAIKPTIQARHFSMSMGSGGGLQIYLLGGADDSLTSSIPPI